MKSKMINREIPYSGTRLFSPGYLFGIKKYVLVLLLVFHLLSAAFSPLYGQGLSKEELRQETILLLSRLDLEQKGLKPVEKACADPQKAQEMLLKYYQKRNTVKHLVDKDSRKDFFGNCADEKTMLQANNALKHIFVGQGSYPPYFCGEDINWESRPVPDNEWVWQLNRMNFWLALGKAYWHTGDEKYAKEWALQLKDWVIKNPNDEEHSYAWRSIEAGIRGTQWTEIFQRFINSSEFTPEVLVVFLNSCFEHAEYLMTRYSSGSNWGLIEAEGLAFLSIQFPEFKKSKEWRNEAFRRFNNEIQQQVYPDGHQRELVVGYHLGCIRMFLRSYEFAKTNKIDIDFPASYINRIEKMCEVPMKLGMPDGTNAQFGDSWRGSPGQHKEKFREWASIFKRDDFLFMATGGEQGKKPDSTAYALPYSGFYSMRSSWEKDAVCMVLKCGPDGGWHCQPDNGTFTLFAGDKNLMPDAGSYIYTGDPENREWFRKTSVHQTLTLDDKNSSYNPKLLLWKPGDKNDILVVENKSYENLTHRRSVIFVDKRYFVIIDEAAGTATGDIKLHFQMAPGDTYFNDKDLAVKSGYQTGWNVLVRTNKQKGVNLEKEMGQVSFHYNKKEPRPAFCYHIRKDPGMDKITFVTLVVPFNDAEPRIKVEYENQPGSPFVSLRILENGEAKEIGYSFKDMDK